MRTQEKQLKQPWFDVATHRLRDLCVKFAAQANEYDSVPSDHQLTAAFKFLESLQCHDGPTIDITSNVDIAFLWKVDKDKIRAFVKPDGHVLCFQNKKQVEPTELCHLVERVPA